MDQLDEFFGKWEEVSSRIASSRPLCELDSVVRSFCDCYSGFKDTSRYITIPELIDVYYFDGPMSEETYGGSVTFMTPRDRPLKVKDTLHLEYTPILAGYQKSVLYKDASMYQLLMSVADYNEERAKILRTYIPLRFTMAHGHFVNSMPYIYEIHFYDNGIMVNAQESASYVTEQFFPADGSPSYEIGCVIE